MNFCDDCGGRLVSGDCFMCMKTSNSLAEFENEED
jgi:hypothetical protein